MEFSGFLAETNGTCQKDIHEKFIEKYQNKLKWSSSQNNLSSSIYVWMWMLDSDTTLKEQKIFLKADLKNLL